MFPFMIPPASPFPRWRRLGGITGQPIPDDIMIELFTPQQAGITLAHDVFLLWVRGFRNDVGIKLISFALALGQKAIESLAEKVFSAGSGRLPPTSPFSYVGHGGH